MVETYRLFEFTAFLSLAKLLPQDSVSDIDVVVDEEVVECDEDSTEAHQETCLDEEEFERLREFYQGSSSDRDPVSGEDTALNTIENTIVSRKKTDRHGRHVRYSPYSPSSKHSSCIVYMTLCKGHPENEQIIFGEIKKAFVHKFHGCTNSLVYVQWYKQFHKDTISNLIFVNTSEAASVNPIANINDISVPLVHSYDTEEEKLWILNARIH